MNICFFLILNVFLRGISADCSYIQPLNFNENTGGAEALRPFSCSLMVMDIRKPYNSTVTKIFSKYMNTSKFKLFTSILYFQCAYNELPVCKHKCLIT
jgi:hypothetical protein